MDAKTLIASLQLERVAEGGWVRRIYQSSKIVEGRSLGDVIYYLLEGYEFSAFHRLDCDEIWHFYGGSPVYTYAITPAGQLREVRLGNQLEHPGLSSNAVFHAGDWFAATVMAPNGFALLGCSTAPAFSPQAYELANSDQLSQQFPQYRALIQRLCSHA